MPTPSPVYSYLHTFTWTCGAAPAVCDVVPGFAIPLVRGRKGRLSVPTHQGLLRIVCDALMTGAR